MHSVGSVANTWSGMDLAVRTSQAPASSGRPVLCSNTTNEQKEKKKGDSLELEERLTSKLSPRAANLLFSPLSKFAPQHLAICALGDLVNERDATSQLFVVRQSLFHEQLHFFLAQFPLLNRHDIRARPICRGVVGSRHANHGRFFDARVREEEVLELGGRDLQTFVFEELL